jgi:hypothetical protein
MKIFLICSKRFYSKVPPIKQALEDNGHIITLPNSYNDPAMEDKMRNLSAAEHATWKASMLHHSEEVIAGVDAVLVLNFKKDDQENYIGGATFLEMYDAFRLGKKIFLYNEVSKSMLRDEILGFQPMVINGDLSQAK